MSIGLARLLVVGPWVAGLPIRWYREEIVKASCDNEIWQSFLAEQGDALPQRRFAQRTMSALIWILVTWFDSVAAIALLQIILGHPVTLTSLVASDHGLLVALITTISVLSRRH